MLAVLSAQTAPPLVPIAPVETEPPPLSVSCTSSYDCRRWGSVCELPAGPAMRGICGAPRTETQTCSTDAQCGATRHCSEHKLALEGNNLRWVGFCLPGARTDADGPKPVATNGVIPLRYEYTGGQVPPGYVLLERPDMRVLVPGLVVFAGSYALAQIWWVFGREEPWSLIPIAGPMVQFAVSGRSVSSSELGARLLVTFGQALGVTGIILGLASPLRWLERGPVTLVPTPNGVSMSGTF